MDYQLNFLSPNTMLQLNKRDNLILHPELSGKQKDKSQKRQEYPVNQRRNSDRNWFNTSPNQIIILGVVIDSFFFVSKKRTTELGIF